MQACKALGSKSISSRSTRLATSSCYEHLLTTNKISILWPVYTTQKKIHGKWLEPWNLGMEAMFSGKKKKMMYNPTEIYTECNSNGKMCERPLKTLKHFMNLVLLLLLSRFRRVRLCATPSMAAHQAPPSLGFSRQEHWSGLPFLLQGMKVKRESEVAQSCPTLCDPIDSSPPGSSAHGIFQARVLEWIAIAFSIIDLHCLA